MIGAGGKVARGVLTEVVSCTPDAVVRAVRPAHALVFKGCQGLTMKGRVRILTDSPHMDLKCLYVACSRTTRHDLRDVV